MSGNFPGSPRTLRGGIVLIDADSAKVLQVITLQYNPDTLTRTVQLQAATGDTPDHLEALRLKGPPIETIKVEAEIDASDLLEDPDSNPNAVEFGIQPQIAALEAIAYPKSTDVADSFRLADAGTMEIAPLIAPLPLFVWGKNRVLPVRITEMSITEEAFSPSLNPLRAKVSLSLRVLTVNDLGMDSKGGNLAMLYHEKKEQMAALAKGALQTLGLQGIP
jgi:Contractile injection system tube protein